MLSESISYCYFQKTVGNLFGEYWIFVQWKALNQHFKDTS